jgi:hypothetical protein
MTKAAMTELQQQIEDVRREAYAAGYAAAMQVILGAASSTASKAGTTAAGPGRRGPRRIRQAAPTKPTRSRRTRATPATATTRPSADGRAQRGNNALIIEEILKTAAPSTVRAAEIRKALQDKGVAMSFTSIHHALRQLEARNAAEQVGDSKSWRHRDGGAA